MINAVVLINAKLDDIQQVAQRIADLEGVSEVYSVAGRVDLVAVLRVPEPDDLERVVAGTIDRIPGIEETETLIAFRKFSSETLDAGYELGLD